MREDLPEVMSVGKKDMEALQRFFPEADMHALSEVQMFHTSLTKVLRKELKESREKLEGELAIVEERTDAVERELKAVGSISTLPRAVFDTYSQLEREIGKLIDANDLYDKMSELDDEETPIAQDRDAAMASAIERVEDTINGSLSEFNEFVCGKTRSAPRITITSEKSYRYGIENDVGAGSQARALILFDLAILSKTKLPAIVHDSSVIRDVEDSSMLRILELYKRSGKQVFIAVDKAGTYLDEEGNPPANLNDAIVLELSRGHEPFGRALNLVSSGQ